MLYGKRLVVLSSTAGITVILLAMFFAPLPAHAGDPCCAITAIDARTGVVTAKVNATGKAFQFAVKDRALLSRLRVGQGIFANFKTQQVSVDGVDPCCGIVSLRAAGRLAGSSVRPAQPVNELAGRTTPHEPTNGIRALQTNLQQLNTRFQDVQNRINVAAGRRSVPIAGARATWNEPTNGMRSTLANMQPLAHKLQSFFSSNGNATAAQLSQELVTQLNALSGSLNQLAGIRNAGQAQVSANAVNQSMANLRKLMSRLSIFGTGASGMSEGDAEKEHQSLCDQEGQNHNPPRACRADCTLTSTGSDPGDFDDTFSCTCIC